MFKRWAFALLVTLAVGGLVAESAPPVHAAPAESAAAALDAQLRTVAIQDMLIGSGNLDVEAGHGSQPLLQAAARDFRLAIGSAETGPLTAQELKKLEDASAAFLGFADYTQVFDDDTKVSITLPRTLFSPVPKPKTERDPNWTTYVSSYGGMQIHVFRYRLLAETPVSLMSRLIERRQNISFERYEISGTDFAVEATADYPTPGGKRYFMTLRGWETDGFIIGFQAIFDIEHSPALQVPDLVVPQSVKTTHYPNGRAAGRTVEVPAAEGNWRHVIKALVHRIGSEFEVNNGWRRVSTKDCRIKSRLTTQRGGRDRPKVVRVMFATDRVRLDGATAVAGSRPDVDRLFAPEPDAALHIGCAIVGVPSDPAVAARIPRPKRTAAGGLEPFDPRKHFGLDSVIHFDSSARLGRGEEWTLVDEGKEGAFERALLFIHGYNTSFAEALLRIAQIAGSVDEDLRVYLFSWPSRERYFSYIDDLDNSERAEQSLQYFMKLILRDANVRQLDVIAHSMGSQSLLRSIDGMRGVFDHRAWDREALLTGNSAKPTQVRLRLGQVIFAAPDVSRSIFERQLAALVPYARRVTVYTSEADQALWFSEFLRFTPRAGKLAANKEPFRVRGAHVIDVTGKPLPKLSLKRLTEFNHNYFVENLAIVRDIQSILNDATARTPRGRAENTRGKLGHTFLEVPYSDRSDQFYWRLIEPDRRDPPGSGAPRS